jgi:signal transduction histidine kinase
MKRLCCIFAFFTIGSYHSFGQQYPFIRFTPRDGLVSASVSKIFQDSKGKMYFLTFKGLSVYDGSRFINYTIDDGLPDAIVNDMMEITPDSFLIATNNFKLIALVRGQLKMVETIGFTPVINKFYKAEDNSIFVATDQGLFQLKQHRFVLIPVLDENKKSIRDLDDLLEIGDFFLLRRYDALNRYSDLFLVNKNTGKTENSLLKMNASSMLPLSDEHILIIVANNLIRCFDLDALGKGKVKETELPFKYRFLKTMQLMNIARDRNKNTWIIMPSSINRLNSLGQQQLFNMTNNLDLNNLGYMFADRENTIWLISKGIGVIKLANNNLEIMNSLIGKNNFVGSEICTTPTTDSVWIFNNFDHALYCYTPNGIQKWQLEADLNVTNIIIQKKSLLLCSINSIYKADNIRNGKPLRLKLLYQNKDATNFNRIITDANGNIFIPGTSITTISVSGDTSITHLPGFSDQLCFDGQVRLWVITRSTAIFCYRVIQQKQRLRLMLEYNYSDKIRVSQPRCIAISKEGKIWIGTQQSGLYCFIVKDTAVINELHITTNDGLTDNFIYNLAIDKTGNLWVGTLSGLDKIYLLKGRYGINNISSVNNLYMHVTKVQVDKYNNVWFSGMQNIMRVSSPVFYTEQFVPQLQISRILNGNNSLGTPKDGLTMPNTTNTLRFEFAVPSSLYEKRILYSYKLEGNEETDWSAASKESTIQFVNLKPGKYKLWVKAFFPSSDLKTQELFYQFSILPNWWQTVWFKLVIGLLIITGIIMLIRLYYERKFQKQKGLLEKHQAVEQERTRISMEIHDDLGAGLTSIRYLATGLNGDKTPATQEKLSKIVLSANELIENMNDIVWTMKTDNNAVGETLSYIRKQVAEQLEYAGINYEFHFQETGSFELTNEQKRNLLLISKEAIHNIIKHARATLVQLSATTENNLFCLSVVDNGKGFNENMNQNLGNGLRNMKARAKEMGGRLDVINKNGTTVKLTLQIPYSHNGR